MKRQKRRGEIKKIIGMYLAVLITAYLIPAVASSQRVFDNADLFSAEDVQDEEFMAKKKGIPGLSFSLNRALGVTAAKQKFARATGIPTTKQGREVKIGRLITRGLLGGLGGGKRHK